MYAFINGKIESKGENLVVLDCNGVGYEIYMGTHSISSLPEIGEQVKVLTYLYVREDAMQLFGFLSKEEKQMFLDLTTVSGVGAKSAIAILSSLTPKDISRAVYSGDVVTLTKVKGLGKKTAERIVLELKGKIEEPLMLFDNINNEQTLVKTSAMDEAVQVLVDMGLTRFDATNLVRNVGKPEDKTEDIITKALRGMK